MKKELTMSIHEFMEVQRGNLTYKDIRKLRQEENKELDRIAGIILNNPKARRMTISLIASINMAMIEQMCYADELGNATQALTSAQYKIVFLMQSALSTIIVISCLFDLGKSILSKGNDDTLSIVLKYVGYEIAAIAAPPGLNMIKNLF